MSLVPAWFKLINLILSKEKPTSRTKQPYIELQETMNSTLRTTFKYYGSDKLANSPFAKKRENPDYIVQVLTGLICLAKGDLIGCELLAQKLGGFPGDEKGMKKFTEVVELIEKNRMGLKFIKEDVTQRVREKADGIVSKMPFGKEIAGDMLAKAMENPG